MIVIKRIRVTHIKIYKKVQLLSKQPPLVFSYEYTIEFDKTNKTIRIKKLLELEVI